MAGLAPLEYWEVAAKKAVRSDPTLDWVSRAREILLTLSSDDIFSGFGGMRSLMSEPHALGWLYQAMTEDARKRAFEDHVQREEKHATMTTTTQVFTPRWIADLLCQYAITSDSQTVHDPTCGSGQMLLAAYDRLRELGASPSECLEKMSGADLDPAVVDVARDILFLRVRQDDNFRGLRTRIERTIAVHDVLDGITGADVLITNPPFMGRRSMSPAIKQRLEPYAPYDIDLFSVVIHLCQTAAADAIAIVAPQVFWFLHRYEPLRRSSLDWGDLNLFCLLGERTFRTLSGSKSNAAAFVQTRDSRGPTDGYDVRGLPTEEKRTHIIDEKPICFETATMEQIPGFPMAFWLPESLVNSFEKFEPLSEQFDVPGGQNKTGDNARFIREISSVDPKNIRSTPAFSESHGDSDARWVVYSKGGPFAPWWGNWDWVVDWSEEALDFYADNPTSNLLAEQYRFRPGLCYSDFGSVGFAARWLPRGCLFDMTGPAIFSPNDDEELLFGLLAILNSSAVRDLLAALNPSLHTQAKDVRNVPVPPLETIRSFSEQSRQIVQMVRDDDPGFRPLERALDADVSALYDVKPPAIVPLHHQFTDHKN